MMSMRSMVSLSWWNSLPEKDGVSISEKYEDGQRVIWNEAPIWRGVCVESVEPGRVFEAKVPDGSMQQIMVVKVDGDAVTIDTNHPLAGVALNFDINVVSVREATKEELEHGHSYDREHSHH